MAGAVTDRFENGGTKTVVGIKELVDSGLSYVPPSYVRPPAERPCLSEVCYTAELPIIDLAQLFGHGRLEVLRAIADACQNWGFFQVINHGVSTVAMARLWAAVRQFFSLPAEARMQYYAELLEQKEVSYFTSHLPAKEKYSEWKDSLYFRCDPKAPDALQQAPEFCRKPVLEYLKQTSTLATAIYQAILETLGLNSDYKADGAPEICSGLIMGVHYYPSCPDPSLTFGQSRHSDITLLTVVLQDEVGGLQVMNQGRWVAVKPVEDSFVINVGDPIQILSNGKYKSVEHRIVLNKEKPRISMACFFNPLPEARIAPLAKLLGEDNPPLYKECIYGDYSNNALSKGLDGKSPLGFVTHTCI